MEKALCQRILQHSGLAHWPFKMVSLDQFNTNPPPLLSLDCSKRPYTTDAQTAQEILADSADQLLLTYSSAMIKKPMDLVASICNLVAQHYLLQSRQIPPTGQEKFSEAAEIISIYMGFGVLVANSAYTFRGSCASCLAALVPRPRTKLTGPPRYDFTVCCHGAAFRRIAGTVSA